MKAITLIQPWASLIIDGRKTIETRSWDTKYRGPLAIHAGLKVDEKACVQFGYDPRKIPTGKILGTVDITECLHFTHETSRLFTLEEVQYGDFTLGRYGFVLENPKKLEKPIPVRGSLGLWTHDILSDDRVKNL